MVKTMKAAVMTAANEDLDIRDVPIPAVAPGTALVKVDVCGLCHSDLHFWRGEHDLPRDLPATLGHEGIGTVVEVGKESKRLAVGDRVGIGYVYGACGHCRECLTGYETHCDSVKSTAAHVEGCFAEYVLVRDDWATKIPKDLDIVEAAPLLCAGVAAYSAVRKAHLEPGELVAVFGAGGLGAYAIQIAKSFGARVAAVDVSDGKLATAQSVGADILIRADHDASERLREMGGADACFNFAPVAASWRQMLEGAATRARLVLVSLPPDPLAFDAGEVIEKGLRIMGSADGTRQEIHQLMRLASAGVVRSLTEAVPFAHINDAFSRLAGGQVDGRLVIDMR